MGAASLAFVHWHDHRSPPGARVCRVNIVPASWTCTGQNQNTWVHRTQSPTPLSFVHRLLLPTSLQKKALFPGACGPHRLPHPPPSESPCLPAWRTFPARYAPVLPGTGWSSTRLRLIPIRHNLYNIVEMQNASSLRPFFSPRSAKKDHSARWFSPFSHLPRISTRPPHCPQPSCKASCHLFSQHTPSPSIHTKDAILGSNRTIPL